MHRFFIPVECITQNTIVFSDDQIHQIRNVLRLKPGDRITVLDNSGCEYEIELGSIQNNRAAVSMVSKTISPGEPQTKIILYQALLKNSKFELVLQKCTEIGVTSFVPVICQRCIRYKQTTTQINRWQRIILEAAEQSRRGKLPLLYPASQFKDVCQSVKGCSLLLWEQEKAEDIRGILRNIVKQGNTSNINIFVGPEGGFTTNEVDFARSCDIVSTGLGNRILRAETAGLVASAIVFYELGDM